MTKEQAIQLVKDRSGLLTAFSGEEVIKIIEAIQQVESEDWVKVEDGLPPVDKHGESECMLCFDENVNRYFVAFYVDNLDRWMMPIGERQNIQTKATQWRPIQKTK